MSAPSPLPPQHTHDPHTQEPARDPAVDRDLVSLVGRSLPRLYQEGAAGRAKAWPASLSGLAACQLRYAAGSAATRMNGVVTNLGGTPGVERGHLVPSWWPPGIGFRLPSRGQARDNRASSSRPGRAGADWRSLAG